MERPGELLSVNAAEDDRALLIVDGAEVHAKRTAVCETLRGQRVDNERVRAVPTSEIRGSAHDADGEIRAILANTKDLLVQPGSCDVPRSAA